MGTIAALAKEIERDRVKARGQERERGEGERKTIFKDPATWILGPRHGN